MTACRDPFERPPRALDGIAELLTERVGLRFATHNVGDLEEVTRRARARYDLDSDSDLLDLLLRRRETLEWMVHELTIGESYFFREPAQFNALVHHVVPAIVARRAGDGDTTFRAWSAGCAAGEETYSIAIALRQALPDPDARKVSVLGTDINRHFLERAESARFRQWSLRRLGDGERSLYFHYEKGPGDYDYRLREPITRLAHFEYLNLVLDEFPDVERGIAEFDVLFCRNVLIYFSAEDAARIATRIAACLREGGYAFFGASDPLPAKLPGLDAEEILGARVYRRRSTDSLPPPSTDSLPHQTPRWSKRLGGSVPPDERTPPASGRRPRDSRRQQLVMCRTRAQAHHDRGELQEACAWGARWTELDPTSAFAFYLLGTIHRDLGDYPRARQALQRSLCLAPENVLSQFAMAEVVAAEGQPEAAATRYRQVLDLVGRYPEDAILPGSHEVRAGWLRRVVERRLRHARGGRLP